MQDTRAGDRRTQDQDQEESLRMFFGDRRSDLDMDEEATLQEVSVELWRRQSPEESLSFYWVVAFLILVSAKGLLVLTLVL